MDRPCPTCGVALAGDAANHVCGTPMLGHRLAGRYELLRIAGAGGMGVVYEAHDHELGEKVAVKLLRPDAISPELEARLRSEIKTVGLTRFSRHLLKGGYDGEHGIRHGVEASSAAVR